MTRCKWPGCTDDADGSIEHVPTGTLKHYCGEHAPDADGETWEIP